MQPIPNSCPGEVLREEFLDELGISPERLAHDLHLPAATVAQLLSGQASLTVNAALRLARYFGNSPKFWLGLQNGYDLEEEQQGHAAELEAIQLYTKKAA